MEQDSPHYHAAGRNTQHQPRGCPDIFYQTDVCTMIHDPRYGLHLMSDTYVVNDIIAELQRKQG